MPYKKKGKCVYKKDTGKKVGCTAGPVDKYLAALHASDETKEEGIVKIEKSRLKEIIKEEMRRLEETFVVEHSCANHVHEDKTGKRGTVLAHTLYEDGTVTHYDVEFDDEIKLNIPVSELTVITERTHGHAVNMPAPAPKSHGGHEGKMAKQQLVNMAEQSHELLGMIENGEELEEWVQLKIIKASDYINSVYRHLHGEEILHSMESGGGCAE
tara:strand:- start:837 stop:1475 length:639 start_codon:yes stop_codon:yes gene_type:complete